MGSNTALQLVGGGGRGGSPTQVHSDLDFSIIGSFVIFVYFMHFKTTFLRTRVHSFTRLLERMLCCNKG